MARKPVTRDTLTTIEAEQIGQGMPVLTQGAGGDARAMLLRFHANFPFLDIEPFPAAAAMILFDATGNPVDLTVPDGTLWCTLIAQGVVMLGAPGVPLLVPAVQNQSDGGARLPINYPVRLFMFGKRQLSFRGVDTATLSAFFYSTVDTGLGDN